MAIFNHPIEYPERKRRELERGHPDMTYVDGLSAIPASAAQ
jgi:hypothetical protein